MTDNREKMRQDKRERHIINKWRNLSNTELEKLRAIFQGRLDREKAGVRRTQDLERYIQEINRIIRYRNLRGI